jgi:hypothetical protein
VRGRPGWRVERAHSFLQNRDRNLLNSQEEWVI